VRRCIIQVRGETHTHTQTANIIVLSSVDYIILYKY